MSHDPVSLRRRNRLSLSVMLVLFGAAIDSHAGSVFVTNCNDSGLGSLRNAVSIAMPDDIVDMSGLTTSSAACANSTITLRTGDIVIYQTSLSIVGPGVDKLTVTGKYLPAFGVPYIEPYRIFTHNAAGTLTLQNFSIAEGYVQSTTGNAAGGCIYSLGSVTMHSVHINACRVVSGSGLARGGALYALGASTLVDSGIYGSSAYANDHGGAVGGAICALNGFSATSSTISGNSVRGTSGLFVQGGGIYQKGGPFFLESSTISNNGATQRGGGAKVITTSPITIVNSTIALNFSTNGGAGGIYLGGVSMGIYNSTIAFNVGATDQKPISPGIGIAGIYAGATVTLDSNIISNNTYATSGTPDDISAENATVTGAKNLIFAPDSSVPTDTRVNQCPLLGTLRNNGGPTNTIAIMSHSPAVDHGNNVYSPALAFDQRGPTFARQSGSVPDIGSYELQQNDVVFDSGFDGCPAL